MFTYLGNKSRIQAKRVELFRIPPLVLEVPIRQVADCSSGSSGHWLSDIDDKLVEQKLRLYENMMDIAAVLTVPDRVYRL